MGDGRAGGRQDAVRVMSKHNRLPKQLRSTSSIFWEVFIHGASSTATYNSRASLVDTRMRRIAPR